MMSSGHWGTPGRTRSCRSIWKCPEDLRRVKKELTEMIGDPWKTSPRQEEKPRIYCRVYVTLERQFRYGGHKRLHGVLQARWSESAEFANTDTVNDEVVQTGRASSIVSPVISPSSLSSGTVQSSSSGTALAAGRSAPEDSNGAVATVAEISADDEINDSVDRNWR